jgi:hypothetical protein
MDNKKPRPTLEISKSEFLLRLLATEQEMLGHGHEVGGFVV